MDTSAPDPPEPWARRLGRFAPWLAVGLLLLHGLSTLMREPCVGVADNLDYWRVARPAGIEVGPQPRQGTFVVCSYPEIPADLFAAASVPSALALGARALGPLLGTETGRFDLRQLGLLYWLLAAGLLVGALAGGAPAVPTVLVTWLLVDPGYLLFFNSLYGDPAAIVGLLAASLGVWMLHRRPGWGATACLLGAAFVGFSRMQFAPFPAVVLLVLVASRLRVRARPSRGETVCALGLAVFAIAAPAHFLWGAGPRFPDANAYNAVFGGIARVASDPAHALAALGLPAEFHTRGTADYFAARVGPEDPVLPALRRISRLRLAALYATDGAAIAKTTAAIEQDLRRRATHARGNYPREQSAGKRRELRSPWSFSAFRERLLGFVPGRLVLGLVLALGVFLGARWIRRGFSDDDTVFGLLTAWLGVQAAVAVLGEGFVNLHQHLLGARLALDLALVLAAARLSRFVARRFRNEART